MKKYGTYECPCCAHKKSYEVHLRKLLKEDKQFPNSKITKLINFRRALVDISQNNQII